MPGVGVIDLDEDSTLDGRDGWALSTASCMPQEISTKGHVELLLCSK